MKRAYLVSALGGVALSAALAGCDTPGSLDPAVALQVANAYNDVCAALPALGPVSANLSANAKSAYASAQQICSNGAPTNAVVAGVDILAIESALLPYFKKATAQAPNDVVLSRAKVSLTFLDRLKK